DSASGHRGIELLPPTGAKIRHCQPRMPPGIGLDLPPVRHLKIQRALELAPLSHGLRVWRRRPGHRLRLHHSRWKRAALEIIRDKQGSHRPIAEHTGGVDQLCRSITLYKLLALDTFSNERLQLLEVGIDTLAPTHNPQPAIMFNEHISRRFSNGV